MKISYDSSGMMADIIEDIAEFGGKHPCWVIKKRVSGTAFGVEVEGLFIVNYLTGSTPPSVEELDGGVATMTTLEDALFDIMKQHCA